MDDLDMQRIKNLGLNSNFSPNEDIEKNGCMPFFSILFILIVTFIILYLIKK